MLYFKGCKKIKCKDCKGKAFYVLEGYEYICNSCSGLGYSLKEVLVDMETLAKKIGERIKCKEREKNLRK